MIAPAVREQRNAYKGGPPRPWIRVRILHADGRFLDLDLVADTGSPLALIVSLECLLSFRSKETANVMSNFGPLEGGLLRIAIPEVGFDARLEAFGGDRLATALRRSHEDFGGLVGLPLLRMFEYGGDWDEFWVRTRSAGS